MSTNHHYTKTNAHDRMAKFVLGLLLVAAGIFTPQAALASEIEVEKDELTGEEQHLLLIKSENVVRNSIGAEKNVSLIIRCSPSDSDLYIATPTYNGLSKTVYIRWNEGPIETQYWGRGTRGDAFFSQTPRAFLKKMTENETLVIGWTPYSSTRVAARYALAEHKENMIKMNSFCVKGR